MRAAAQQQRDASKRVVITGMGCCTVFGNDPDEFYNNLLAGKSGISLIEGWDTGEST